MTDPGATPNFDGCIARVQWAMHALNTLDEEFRIWMLEHNTGATTLEYYAEADVHVFRLTPDFPPLRFGVITGSIVHQLRSTLDNLVWQLVIRNGKTPRAGMGGNKFPIVLDLEENVTFAEKAKKDLRGVHSDDVAFIERLQPYQCKEWGLDHPVSEHPLGRLARLSNVDKHQVLRILGVNESHGPIGDVTFGGSNVEKILFQGFAPVEQRYPGAIVGCVQAVPSGFHHDMHMNYGGFGRLVFEDGLAIVPALRAIIAAIEYLIVRPVSTNTAAVGVVINPVVIGRLYEMVYATAVKSPLITTVVPLITYGHEPTSDE